VFNDESVQAIKNIPKWSIGKEDRWSWIKTANGVLSSKLAFKEISSSVAGQSEVNQSLSKIWKSRLHDCLKMHLWRVAAGLLPTKESLSRFATSFDYICVLCDHSCESDVHLFWDCPMARALWFGSRWGIKTDQITMSSSCQIVELLLAPPIELEISFADNDSFLLNGALILDQIWKLRNSKMHEGKWVIMENLERNISMSGTEHKMVFGSQSGSPQDAKKIS
jgi:hypothetical protein